LVHPTDLKRADVRFLWYQLDDELGWHRSGTAQPFIKPWDVKSRVVYLPPIEEQRRIADILDRADALRAKRREALMLLDDLTQSIFLDMFGEPSRNERGWPEAIVADFVEGFESGKSLVADDADDQNASFRVLKVSAVTSGRFRPDESKALPTGYSPPTRHLVRDGDLLFSRANTSELIGATALVMRPPERLALPDKLWRFVWPEELRADPRWVWQLFNRPLFRYELSKRATGTSGSMKNISQAKVLAMQVGLPPLGDQRRYAERVRRVEAASERVSAAIVATDDLFASLQQRAFVGEL
jgi:type I restriction enzyme S subunit